MSTITDLVIFGTVMGIFQAMANAFFTWVANRVVVKRLDTIAEKLSKK